VNTYIVALAKGVKEKTAQFLDNYDLNAADVIPLVFDVFGSMAEVTYKFLRGMCVSICNNDYNWRICCSETYEIALLVLCTLDTEK
jgi:hypothetical protein